MRIRGALGRARIRLGVHLLGLGTNIYMALSDLGTAVAPSLSDEKKRRPVLPGLVVVTLLALGLIAAGDLALLLVREALPHREAAP